MSKDCAASKGQPPSKRAKLWNPAIDDSTDYKSKPAAAAVAAAMGTTLLPNDASSALFKGLPADIFSANPLPSLYNPYFHFAPLLASFQSQCAVPMPVMPKKAVDFFTQPPPPPPPPPRVAADQMPAIRSFNPIVASALGRPLDALNQNCCAMCGTAFRLTGDLVQHMRTNHRNAKNKRLTDKADAKKIDMESGGSCNLVCSICEENFQDEHHLARHVKAHRLE